MSEPLPIIPPHRTPAARAEILIPAVIAVTVAIFIVGVSSLLVAAWPFSFGETPWRFKNGAALLAAGPQIGLLMVVISVAGVYAGAHRAVRGAAVVCLVMAAIIIVVVPFFALDFMTQRRLVAQAAIPALTREGLRLGASAAFLVPFLIWMGRQGWTAGRPDPGAELGQGHGLVVGQD